MLVLHVEKSERLLVSMAGGEKSLGRYLVHWVFQDLETACFSKGADLHSKPSKIWLTDYRGGGVSKKEC